MYFQNFFKTEDRSLIMQGCGAFASLCKDVMMSKGYKGFKFEELNHQQRNNVSGFIYPKKT